MVDKPNGEHDGKGEQKPDFKLINHKFQRMTKDAKDTPKKPNA